MDARKRRTGDRIAYSVGLGMGFFGFLLAVDAALDGLRWWVLMDVLVASINFFNAMCAHERLKRHQR